MSERRRPPKRHRNTDASTNASTRRTVTSSGFFAVAVAVEEAAGHGGEFTAVGRCEPAQDVAWSLTTRDSGAFEIGLDGNIRDVGQMLVIFMLISGVALLLQGASVRFPHGSNMNLWLSWGFLGVLVVGCGTVGLSVVLGALVDLRRSLRPVEPPRPLTMRHDVCVSAAWIRLFIGVLMGVVVPISGLVSMLS
jgi:hypothetical protein